MNSGINIFALLRKESCGYISSHVMNIQNLDKLKQQAYTNLLVQQLSLYMLDTLENTPSIHMHANIVLMPLFTQPHWMLAVWYKNQHKVEFWDPLAQETNFTAWKPRLQWFCEQLTSEHVSIEFANRHHTLQTESVNCGVFVLYIAWQVMQGKSATVILQDPHCCSKFMFEWRKPLATMLAYVHLVQQQAIPNPRKILHTMNSSRQESRKNIVKHLIKCSL